MAGRRSFLASFEIFLVFTLVILLISATFGPPRNRLAARADFAARAETLDDLLSTWQADGRIYETLSAGGSSFYSSELSSIESLTGSKMCLFLDGLPLYRQDCLPSVCSHRFIAQASLLGIVDFREVEVCYSG